MKIIIGYPPTESKKGTATLGQNRQFQWFNDPAFLFPVVMGTAATMLKKEGNDVMWLDCVAEKTSKKEFFELIRKWKPDLYIFETKTPVLRQHWKIINELKSRFKDMKIAIVGDHVTSFPKETMENSEVDYVLTGGEIPAMVVIDAVSRLISGVIKKESLKEESFSGLKTEYPQYTRPEKFRTWKVPKILISGHHKKIEEWKRKNSKSIEK